MSAADIAAITGLITAVTALIAAISGVLNHRKISKAQTTADQNQSLLIDQVVPGMVDAKAQVAEVKRLVNGGTNAGNSSS